MQLPDIRPDHIDMVRQILQQHVPHAQVWVFGSRAKWTARDTSDLDLCISANAALSFEQMGALREAFENSNLPYKVDVVDWATTSEALRAIIDQSKVPLPMAGDETVKAAGGAVCRRGGVMGAWRNTVVGNLLNFSNGRSSPPRSANLQFPVYGSNGIIGSASTTNADENTIIVGRVGSYCGSLYLAETKCWVTDNAIKASPVATNDAKFLFYLLQTLDLNNRRAGSGQPLLNQQILATIPAYVPEPEEQKAIAAVLSALDDKIELNRRMNETLEASARALFRDWFVDFGPVKAKAANAPATLAPEIWFLFPAQLDDEGKPEGWQEFRLDELADYRTGSINPGNQPDTLFEHYSLPAYDAREQPALDLGSTIKSNKTQIPSGAILLSKLNPETPRVWIPDLPAGQPQVASTEFLAFVPKKKVGMALVYSLFNETTFRQTLSGMVTGTSKSHQRVSPGAVTKLIVLTADPQIFSAFEKAVGPMLDQILANRLESRTLAQTRDWLLPKLMSGEIRVADAARVVENAAGMAL